MEEPGSVCIESFARIDYMESACGAGGMDLTAGAERGSAERYIFAAGTFLLLISVVLNVLLARRLWTFTHLEVNRSAERLLKAGTVVPPLVAKRLDGQPIVISYQADRQSTVLYIFTPPCSWCARNIDNFKALLDKEGGQYRFIGLSLSEEHLADYIARNDLKVTVYSGLSPDTLRAYKLGSTPQTIVISPEGKVVQDWAGAYVGEQKSQVEAFFHVRLPGLRVEPGTEKVSRRPTVPNE